MDKYTIIEEKIGNFFIKKAKEYGGLIENYKLIISYDGKLRYELYGTNNAFHGYRKLDEILDLNLIEKLAVSNQTIENTLLNAITKIAMENDARDKQIQLMLLPTQKYSALKTRMKIKDINLKEIL